MMKHARFFLTRSSREAMTCRAGEKLQLSPPDEYATFHHTHSMTSSSGHSTPLLWSPSLVGSHRCRSERGAILPGSFLLNLSQQQPVTCAPGTGPKLLRRNAAPQDVPGVPFGRLQEGSSDALMPKVQPRTCCPSEDLSAWSSMESVCWQQAIGPITDIRLVTVSRLLRATKLLEHSGAHA